MTSDEERRDVAARLMATKAVCESRDYPWMVEDLMQALGFKRYEDAEDGIFERLADLIDRPTCSMSDIGDDTEQVYRCSSCGDEYFMSDVKPYPWRFCPNCGAEVIEECDCDVREL